MRLCHLAEEQLVAGVELQLVRKLHPLEVLGVVSGLQIELSDLVAGLVVEVEGHRLHPGVVGVPGVVHIPGVNNESQVTVPYA